MSGVSPGSAPNTNQQYTDAIESYRSIARWVVSTFGAVAAAFVVGLSLNSLGGLDACRVAMSIACIIIGFGAVVFTITAATAVLEPLRVTFEAPILSRCETCSPRTSRPSTTKRRPPRAWRRSSKIRRARRSSAQICRRASGEPGRGAAGARPAAGRRLPLREGERSCPVGPDAPGQREVPREQEKGVRRRGGRRTGGDRLRLRVQSSPPRNALCRAGGGQATGRTWREPWRFSVIASFAFGRIAIRHTFASLHLSEGRTSSSSAARSATTRHHPARSR